MEIEIKILLEECRKIMERYDIITQSHMQGYDIKVKEKKTLLGKSKNYLYIQKDNVTLKRITVFEKKIESTLNEFEDAYRELFITENSTEIEYYLFNDEKQGEIEYLYTREILKFESKYSRVLDAFDMSFCAYLIWSQKEEQIFYKHRIPLQPNCALGIVFELLKGGKKVNLKFENDEEGSSIEYYECLACVRDNKFLFVNERTIQILLENVLHHWLKDLENGAEIIT